MEKEETMVVHFLNNYHVIGKAGNTIRIKGEFPDIKEEDFVFLNSEQDEREEAQKYKIEYIEYMPEENCFKAIIAAE